MVRLLLASLLVVGLLAPGTSASAANGCPPGWDDKTFGGRADRNGDGIVCVDRSQTANPNDLSAPVIDNNYGGPEPHADPPTTTGGPPYDPGCDPGPNCAPN